MRMQARSEGHFRPFPPCLRVCLLPQGNGSARKRHSASKVKKIKKKIKKKSSLSAQFQVIRSDGSTGMVSGAFRFHEG